MSINKITFDALYPDLHIDGEIMGGWIWKSNQEGECVICRNITSFRSIMWEGLPLCSEVCSYIMDERFAVANELADKRGNSILDQ